LIPAVPTTSCPFEADWQYALSQGRGILYKDVVLDAMAMIVWVLWQFEGVFLPENICEIKL